jgi:hypothetical protein
MSGYGRFHDALPPESSLKAILLCDFRQTDDAMPPARASSDVVLTRSAECGPLARCDRKRPGSGVRRVSVAGRRVR